MSNNKKAQLLPETIEKTIHKSTQKMTLAELQQAFYQTVFDPESVVGESLGRVIDSTEAFSPDQLIDVYRDSILGTLTEALANIYPVCQKLVGEDYFSHMVAGYLREYPSGSPDLADYGMHFSNYIENFEPAKDLVYLSDVASLEWCWHKAFNAADTLEEGVEPVANLSGVAEDDQRYIHFFLNPSAFLLLSDYPVQRIWETNQVDYKGDGKVNLGEGAVQLVIWRNVELGMRIDVLTENEFAFLTAAIEGKSFGEIATLSFASELLEILGRCLQTGLLVGFRLVK